MNICWLFYELGFSTEQYNEFISHVYREALKYNFDSAYIEVRSTVRSPNTGKMIVSACGKEIECHTRLERFYCEISGSSYLRIVGMAIFWNNETIDSVNQLKGLLN